MPYPDPRRAVGPKTQVRAHRSHLHPIIFPSNCGLYDLSTCAQAELAALRRKVAELQVASQDHVIALAMRDSKLSEQRLKLAQAEAKLVCPPDTLTISSLTFLR